MVAGMHLFLRSLSPCPTAIQQKEAQSIGHVAGRDIGNMKRHNVTASSCFGFVLSEPHHQHHHEMKNTFAGSQIHSLGWVFLSFPVELSNSVPDT